MGSNSFNINDYLEDLRSLFLESGYHRSSFRKITKCIGVSERTLYVEIGKKKDLLKVLIDYEYTIWKSLIDQSANQGIPPKEVLIDFIDRLERTQLHSKTPSGSLFCNLTGELGEDDRDILRLIADKYNQIVQDLAHIIDGFLSPQPRISSRELALYILSTIEGCMILAKADNDFWEMKNGFNNIRQLISTI
ncbi:MAG: TetR/AcrR family transcriptional regulator [Bacteroidales bacterium]|nr:TetR/AcrR family transcriptional regulator [Candidatus Latescibacterota bacterium]